jgi:hypothetical protein
MCRITASGHGRRNPTAAAMRRFFMVLSLACGASAQSVAQAPGTTASDTVIRFNVASRTWNWPYLLAHVGLSCRGAAVTVGTTTAPDSAAKDRDRYCAGAVLEMRNSTLTLRGARGEVRVRVRRSDTSSSRRAPMDSTGQPRR